LKKKKQKKKKKIGKQTHKPDLTIENSTCGKPLQIMIFKGGFTLKMHDF
jgi:hypothetical protein